ncbi:MAG: glutamine amidotransferase [Pseudohongiellaceae bacterium]
MLIWQRKVLSLYQLASIGGLQALMLALILFVLWQPALVTERLVGGENAVAVLLDSSASMALIENGETRMDQAQALLSEEGLEELADIYDILPYAFAGEVTELNSFAELPNPGDASNIGSSIVQTLREASNTSLGALILVSDGADNSGNIDAATLSEIVSYGVPIHTVGIGREAIPEDLELTSIQLPQSALPGTTLSAGVSIIHDQGGMTRIKVYNGDELISTEEIELNANQNMTTAFIDVEVSEPGELDLRFTLDPVNGERNLANNSRAQVVDIPDGNYRILYIEGEPRWEYKFMQRALDEDPSVQLSTLLRVTPNKFYRQGIDDPDQLAEGFPLERSELFAYDALIIGSVELAEFNEEQQQMIHDFVSERGGSLMMLAGLNGLGLGGWSESVVSEVLPVRLTADDAAFVRQQAKVIPTPSGLASPILLLSDNPAENLERWNELPNIADYQNLGSLRPAATTLMEIDVNGELQPLLVTQPYGKGQSYIMATGGTWRWQMSMPLEDMSHETFWRQLARGLVVNSPLPFELSTNIENEEIRVRAQVRDPDAEENQGLAVSAVVSSEYGPAMTLELLPSSNQPGVYEASFNPVDTGLFSIEAISRVGNTPVSSVRSAIRYEQNQEAFAIRQNRDLLENLAAVTGGQYWQAQDWDELPEAISYSTAGITEQDIRYLWDAPIIFILLILLKAAEWLLRRRWRII